MQIFKSLSLFDHSQLGELSTYLQVSDSTGTVVSALFFGVFLFFFLIWHISVMFAFQFSFLVFEAIVNSCTFFPLLNLIFVTRFLITEVP